MIDFLKDLNEAQLKAVESTEGPTMIIAGAGSGKTRALTYRVAYLMSKGIDPFNILALTFTNKAAKEMKERVLNLLQSDEARNVWMGTFHSVFARILRIDGHLLGYQSNFTIYDTDDSKSLLRAIVRELNLDPKEYPPAQVLGRISALKTELVSAQEYNTNDEFMAQDRYAKRPHFGQIFSIYNNRLRKAQAMDFDDLLYNTNFLLSDYPEILLKYQKKFKYILVDEYQDTNHVQYMILKQLAARTENICVVGDDAQSIYGFRGANINNILNFRNDYPEYQLFKLEQNYRSTQNIVNAANGVILHNKKQIQKTIWTENEIGEKIKLMRASTDIEEGQLVAGAIFETKMNQQLKNDAFAILYRTNAQSRILEESLRKLNIPYRIYSGISFYNRKEIKDLVAYFRVVVNPDDEEALKRIINYPARGIGETTINKILVAAVENGVGMWTLISNPDKFALDINPSTKNRITGFALMVQNFRNQIQRIPAYELSVAIAQASGIDKELQDDKTPEGISRIENIEELFNGIRNFSSTPRNETQEGIEGIPAFRTLAEYLQDIALLTDADRDDKNNTDVVSLMTIHAAKGLEFPYVFITGLEENLFPSLQSVNSRDDLEEERRLFYVAITRAEKRVFISYAELRYHYGNLQPSEPSRFISNINSDFVDFPGKSRSAGARQFYERREPSVTKTPISGPPLPNKNVIPKQQADYEAGNTSYADIDAIQAGMEVEHQRFGKGKVLTIEGKGADKKATVFFPEVGQKQLLLKFARLRIL